MIRAGAGVVIRKRRSEVTMRDLERRERIELMVNSGGVEMDLKTHAFRRAMGVQVPWKM
jgi:hypothetical protein